MLVLVVFLFCSESIFVVPMRSNLFSTFSSVKFSVSVFVWGSLTCLELRFVLGDMNESIFLYAAFQLDQYCLLKMLYLF